MTKSAIDLTDVIIKKVKDLPIEKQQEILDFVEFIENKHGQNNRQYNKRQKKRIPGLHQGKGWVSDDFNEPLPTDIWEQ